MAIGTYNRCKQNKDSHFSQSKPITKIAVYPYIAVSRETRTGT
ncbi:MAG: hypothetical protein O6940_09700 [Ignavibacteria bacterium]|nr:hypothetical protein [Ignavibacteria bacterium]